VLEKLEEQGVAYIDTYCVDNALARVADPHLVGLASIKEADVCEPHPPFRMRSPLQIPPPSPIHTHTGSRGDLCFRPRPILSIVGGGDAKNAKSLSPPLFSV